MMATRILELEAAAKESQKQAGRCKTLLLALLPQAQHDLADSLIEEHLSHRLAAAGAYMSARSMRDRLAREEAPA